MGPVACYVIPGKLRIHSAPKVASDGIARAVQAVPGKTRERVDDAGPEFRFGVVRHPLDRLVSGWAYFCMDGRISNQPMLRQIGYRHQMPFEAFLEVAYENHWRNQHTRKQVDFIGSQPFDRLVKIENLTDAWEDVRKICPAIRPIGRQNTSTRKPAWKTYYCAEMAQRAELVYADDVALYERAD